MEEGIGFGGGLPDHRHRELYRRWGEGGWGVIISGTFNDTTCDATDAEGNVQVDPRHLATPHDRTIATTSQDTVFAYSQLREATLSAVPPKTARPLMIMQISHPGLQSSAMVNGSRPPWVASIGPTSARPDTGKSVTGWLVGRLVWPIKSRQVVDVKEWLAIVRMFVDAAVVAEKAGWEGVQVHSAHGYLLAEYISPLVSSEPFKILTRANSPDESRLSTVTWCTQRDSSSTAPALPHTERHTRKDSKVFHQSYQD